MEEYEEKYDLSFTARDSEWMKYEFTIPEGMEAEIKDGKVILKRKESEDERIRKEIIRIVDIWTDSSPVVNGIPRETLLAYLEKQKEQKLSTPKYRVGEVMRTKQEAAEGITDGLPVIVSVDDNYYYCTNEKIPIPEQEEYEFPPMNMRKKPAEWSEEDEKKLNGIINCLCSTSGDIDGFNEWYDWLKDLPERFNLQPKQEWSEKDKDYFDAIIAKLEVTQDDAMLTDNQINFLKSLPERLTLQPREKWSEGTKKRLNEISDYLKYKGYEEDADFIQHLRPQPHWKPSEEQLEAVKCAASDVKRYSSRSVQLEVENKPYYSALISLYDDLKNYFNL